jgi:adenine-specific DNA-methyltransferase
MIKDIEDKNESVKINDKELSVLRETFPSCFRVDGSFDVVRFQEQIKDKVDLVHEGYELKFLGKSYAKLLSSIDTTTIIKPDSIHNEKPENRESENIYISGDNLDGLKHILKSYSKEVKCIYIDPPYNTGKDGFVYHDKFNYSANDLEKKLSIDEKQAKRIIDLTKRNSASHSAWLLFMYSRLQLARDLLTNDGVLFISIDDNEQANLKLLCDDIFGEENFVGNIIWQTATDNNPTQIATEHEYVICYAKDKGWQDFWEIPSEKGKLIQAKYLELKKEFGDDLEKIQLALRKWIRKQSNGDDLSGIAHYSYVDSKGVYYPGNSANTKPGGYNYDIIHPITNKVCAKPEYGYRFKKDTFDDAQKNDDVMWGADEEIIPKIKKRLDTAAQKLKSNYYEDNRATSQDLRNLMDGKVVFNNPKSVNFLKHVFKFVVDKNDLVIDFFSGSATTAQAVMELNNDDSGSRKFICIQIPQILESNNKQQKVAFDFLITNNRPTTIDYIGIERIIRAAKKIKEETGAAIDYGFKHYELCEVNPNTLDKCETFDKAALIADTSILDDFGMASVLTTWLVSDGYGFNANVKTVDLKGYTAYYCQKHLYMINPDLTQDSVAILFEKYDSEGDFNPENIVLFGYSFNEWSVNEMLKNNLKVLEKGDKELKINIDVRY